MLTGTLTLTITGTGTYSTGTRTGTLTLILILSSFIIHDAVASCRHTPQSLRDSSPNLGEQLLRLSLKCHSDDSDISDF